MPPAKTVGSFAKITTSIPATITPAGLELDPDTPETLDNDQAEQSKV